MAEGWGGGGLVGCKHCALAVQEVLAHLASVLQEVLLCSAMQLGSDSTDRLPACRLPIFSAHFMLQAAGVILNMIKEGKICTLSDTSAHCFALPPPGSLPVLWSDRFFTVFPALVLLAAAAFAGSWCYPEHDQGGQDCGTRSAACRTAGHRCGGCTPAEMGGGPGKTCGKVRDVQCCAQDGRDGGTTAEVYGVLGVMQARQEWQ